MTFSLDPRLVADTFVVGDLGLCQVLPMNDSRFPWLILVPRVAGLTEIHELPVADRAALIEEAARVGETLKSLVGARKINTAALGNMVAQLHIHVIARFAGDEAWPGPVWGVGKAKAYEKDQADGFLADLLGALEGLR